MTTIDWGPEIKVDGKRPEWLEANQRIAYARDDADGFEHWWYGMGVDPFCAGDAENGGYGNRKGWISVVSIRLPANHTHYVQRANHTHYVQRAKPDAIDWSKPLEAVHADGRVAEVTVTSDRRADFVLARMPNEFLTYFNRVDGRPRRPECGWRIRNVPQQTPTPDVVGRMEALVRRMAKDWTYMEDGRSFSAEARAIVALLPEPVDGDRVAAIDLLDSFGDAMPDTVSLATAAIKKGKQLRQEEINQLHMDSRGSLGQPSGGRALERGEANG